MMIKKQLTVFSEEGSSIDLVDSDKDGKPDLQE